MKMQKEKEIMFFCKFFKNENLKPQGSGPWECEHKSYEVKANYL